MSDIPKNELFTSMIKAFGHKEELEKELYEAMNGYFTALDEEAQIRSYMDNYGFIRVNSSVKFDTETLRDFANEFGFALAMESERFLTDYRNKEPVSVTTYQYAFTVDRLDLEEEESE